MEQMKRSARRFANTTDILAKSLNDSGYGIGETINGGVAPLPQKKEY
jgi:hypothetical protein